MGRDKRLLTVDWNGKTVPLWERQLNLLRQLAPAELLISGPDDLEYPPDSKIIPDQIENGGPLAGISSCLQVARTELLLVLAVDLPNITAEYLESLIRMARPGYGIVPTIDDELEPVAAIYPVEAASLALSCLQSGERSVQALVRRLEQSGLVRIKPVTATEAPLFRNWNTPEDRQNK
jgi:molybdopterin-guanine dinucleotide biosynthesis protein A